MYRAVLRNLLSWSRHSVENPEGARSLKLCLLCLKLISSLRQSEMLCTANSFQSPWHYTLLQRACELETRKTGSLVQTPEVTFVCIFGWIYWMPAAFGKGAVVVSAFSWKLLRRLLTKPLSPLSQAHKLFETERADMYSRVISKSMTSHSVAICFWTWSINTSVVQKCKRSEAVKKASPSSSVEGALSLCSFVFLPWVQNFSVSECAGTIHGLHDSTLCHKEPLSLR